ncbi:exported nucleotide-binding protein, partial [Nannochloropsis gaditana CCMP526]|uniref:exported nucleotide-binding protein n=1 Tax=Nannochloropsis gaditana (strain CCMP526) TaxID=1093141 RepID=UPI00029F6934
MRPSSRPLTPPQIVNNADGATTMYWQRLAFIKRKGGKRRFHVVVKANECAPETLEVDASAYLVNTTDSSCITPLANPALVKVRYSKRQKKATCGPTPAPSINPQQPFVLFGEGQRFSQGARLAPFQNRLSMLSSVNRHEDIMALHHLGDRQLQSIDSPQACYEYCSMNGGQETPFFSWNTGTSQCFCCVGVCKPFPFDPDSNVFEVRIPRTLPPMSAPTAAPTHAPAMTPTAAPTTAATASPTAAPTLVPTMTPEDISWAKSFGGTNANQGTGIAVDTSASSYTTGSFQGTMTVGNTTLKSAGSDDIFMIKLDPDGNPVWAQGFGGTSSNQGT